MMHKSKTKKVLVLLMVIFIIVLVLDVVWYSYIKSETNEVLELKKDVRKEAVQNYNLINVKRQTADLKALDIKLDDVFVSRENIVTFIELIENMAQQSDVDMQISITNGDDEEKYHPLTVLVQSTGSWSDVTTFVQMIESLPHSVFINVLKLNVVGIEDSLGWRADIVFSVMSK